MTGRSHTGVVSILIALNLLGVASVAAEEKPKQAAANAATGWTAKIEPQKKVFSQTGVASFYTAEGPTASGVKSKPEDMTAAHRTLPFGSKLKVQELKTGREVVVTVTDRGPFKDGRIIDMSIPAAKALGFVDQGLAPVRLTLME